jgi:hypothetical protein
MEPLQDQISLLNHKLDALHQSIETLLGRLASRVSSEESSSLHEPMAQILQRGAALVDSPSPVLHSMADLNAEYKDILIDDSYREPSDRAGDKELTPEIQVQRLMAQLTAAYNRIADLDEQLLARRIH